MPSRPFRLSNTLFSNTDKARAWLQLADLIRDTGTSQIPCTNAPDLFFPDQTDVINAAQLNMHSAIRLCKEACPIVNECATYAIKYQEDYGIWGGLTAPQRRRIRSAS